MLSKEERQRVISAVWRWASQVPDVPVVGFLGGGLLTPKEVAKAVEGQTSEGQAFLEIIEHGVRREGIEKVVQRLMAPPSNA